MKIIYTANLITIKHNKVLLVKRNLNHEEGDLWSLPGGTKERGENIKNTLIREIKEEVKENIKNLSFFKKYKRKSKNKTVLATYFTGEIRGDIKLNKKELSDYNWFLLDKVPEKLAYQQNKVLEDYLSYIK